MGIKHLARGNIGDGRKSLRIIRNAPLLGIASISVPQLDIRTIIAASTGDIQNQVIRER